MSGAFRDAGSRKVSHKIRPGRDWRISAADELTITGVTWITTWAARMMVHSPADNGFLSFVTQLTVGDHANRVAPALLGFAES